MAKTINQLTQAESINVSDKLIIEQVDGTKSITINELDKRFIQDVNLEGYATKEELETKAEKVHTHDTYATTVNVNSLLEGKADTTHNHDSVYSKTNHTHEEYAIKSNTYTKEEVDGLIPEEVDLSDYETTVSVDGKLASKADKSHTHEEYANVEHTHTNYAVKSDTYTKAEVDELIPEEVDLSDYETTVSVNEKLANKSDITHNHDSVYSKTNHTHEEYAKVANTYTKGEIDSKISEIVPPEVDLSLYATKEELKSKAEKVHTHEEYETTVSVDGKLASKADKSHTHEEYETTVSVDGKLLNKAEKVHTHEEYANVEHTHTNYAIKSDTYTKAEVDELIPEEVDLSSYATKVELNSKANTDHNHDSVYSTISHTHDNYAVKNDTYTKTELDGKFEEVFQSVSNGKQLIASAITDKKVPTSSSDSFETMANNIKSIPTSDSGSGINVTIDGEPVDYDFNLNKKIVKDWIPVEEDLPFKSYGSSAVIYNNEIHILGGGSIYYYTQHYKYDGESWSSVSTLPYNCYQSCAVVYNGEIHILGSSQSSSLYTKHYKYDGERWTSVSTLPYDFNRGCAVVYNDEIHILGGNNSTVRKYHYKYDGESWTSVSTLPYDLYDGCAIVHNGEIHILGSGHTASSDYHYKYDGESWTSVSTLPYDFNKGAVIVYNDEIHMFGGYKLPIVHYTYSNNEWILTSIMKYGDFVYGACQVLNSEIHVVSGGNDKNTHIKLVDVELYKLQQRKEI